MAVADVLDALAFRRSYKEAMDIKEAIKIIVDESGTHFDPTFTTIRLRSLIFFMLFLASVHLILTLCHSFFYLIVNS